METICERIFLGQLREQKRYGGSSRLAAGNILVTSLTAGLCEDILLPSRDENVHTIAMNPLPILFCPLIILSHTLNKVLRDVLPH